MWCRPNRILQTLFCLSCGKLTLWVKSILPLHFRGDQMVAMIKNSGNILPPQFHWVRSLLVSGPLRSIHHKCLGNTIWAFGQVTFLSLEKNYAALVNLLVPLTSMGMKCRMRGQRDLSRGRASLVIWSSAPGATVGDIFTKPIIRNDHFALPTRRRAYGSVQSFCGAVKLSTADEAGRRTSDIPFPSRFKVWANSLGQHYSSWDPRNMTCPKGPKKLGRRVKVWRYFRSSTSSEEALSCWSLPAY